MRPPGRPALTPRLPIHVRRQLDGNTISGSIPPNLGALASLQTLWLSNNTALAGTIPDMFSGMSALADFRVANTAVNGAIPATLGSVTTLVTCDLRSSGISGTLSQTFGTSVAATGLLTSLQVSGTAVTTTNGLCDIFTSGSAQSAQCLAMAKLYSSLFWSGAALSPLPAAFTNPTVCTWAGVTCTSGATGGVSRISLRNGGLSITGTIPAELGSVSSLTDVYLDGNNMQSTLPSALGSLTALKTLCAHPTDSSTPHTACFAPQKYVTFAFLRPLPARVGLSCSPNRPSCRSWLHGNLLTGTIPTSFGSLSAMTDLCVSSVTAPDRQDAPAPYPQRALPLCGSPLRWMLCPAADSCGFSGCFPTCTAGACPATAG